MTAHTRTDGVPRLRLSSSANLPDVVVWNIGEAKAPLMGDLGEGEWRSYVCVEPSVLAVPARVEPGASWVATHELLVLRSPLAATTTFSGAY